MGWNTRGIVVGVALAGLLIGATAGCGSTPDVTIEASPGHGPDSLPDGITVSGVGEVHGTPDTLTATVSVSVKRGDVGTAVADNAAAANAVIDAAKDAGIDEADIQTQNYSVNQEWRYPDGGSPVADGYRVTNSVVVRITELETAGSVIDAVLAAGGDDVSLNTVAFTLEEDGPALEAARQAAFEDAQAKAKQYAELSGQGLSGAEAISDVNVEAERFSYVGAAVAMEAATSTTPIEGGQVTTRVTVNARFGIG